jgi:hypothetical protein
MLSALELSLTLLTLYFHPTCPPIVSELTHSLIFYQKFEDEEYDGELDGC